MAKWKNQLERFDDNYIPDPNSGCWLWIGNYSDHRYGRFTFNGKRDYAHRCSWRIFRGTIPIKMNVLHKCDTPECVNPDHLFLGSQKENIHDMMRKNRHKMNGAKTPRSVLNKKQVIKIREILENSNLSCRKIGMKYGVTGSCIEAIKYGRTWKNV